MPNQLLFESLLSECRSPDSFPLTWNSTNAVMFLPFIYKEAVTYFLLSTPTLLITPLYKAVLVRHNLNR